MLSFLLQRCLIRKPRRIAASGSNVPGHYELFGRLRHGRVLGNELLSVMKSCEAKEGDYSTIRHAVPDVYVSARREAVRAASL